MNGELDTEVSINLEIIENCQTRFCLQKYLDTKKFETISMGSLEDRLKQLDEIREKVEFYETQMDGLLLELGWTRDKLPKLTKVKQESELETECGAAGSSGSVNDRNIATKQHSQTDDLEAVVDLCSTIEQKRLTATPFTDLNKLKRDLKRRRVKYRTTKTGPLTYTEELRELINLQMELIDDNK